MCFAVCLRTDGQTDTHARTNAAKIIPVSHSTARESRNKLRAAIGQRRRRLRRATLIQSLLGPHVSPPRGDCHLYCQMFFCLLFQFPRARDICFNTVHESNSGGATPGRARSNDLAG